MRTRNALIAAVFAATTAFLAAPTAFADDDPIADVVEVEDEIPADTATTTAAPSSSTDSSVEIIALGGAGVLAAGGAGFLLVRRSRRRGSVQLLDH